MALGRVFDAFVESSSVTVMLRGILEHALPPERINAMFRQIAQKQYEDALLFSTCVDVLSLSVAGMRSSVNASYHALKDQVGVSVTSLYNKLKGTEPAVSQALVRDTAQRLGPLIRCMKATRKPLLRGYRVKILDGNHLSGTQHRLAETRGLNSQPLPGHALVVLEPKLMLMTDVFPCEDAYAQERALTKEVVATAERDDCWIADRNFCTTQFLFGFHRENAKFIIRQHASTLSGKHLLGNRCRRGGCTATGKIFEQRMEIVDPEKGESLVVRRITIELQQPTSDGDTEVHILTNVSTRDASAKRIADLYRHRWTIENAFQELGQALRSEINTLCYPKAALLCFCLGVVLYNTLSTLKAAMRSVHGNAADNLSGYYLAEEISAIYSGMMIAIPASQWTKAFAEKTAVQMAAELRRLARHVDPARFAKTKRGPKKPPPKRTGGIREKHVATARLLQQRAQLKKTA
jgi:hypothetical protein